MVDLEALPLCRSNFKTLAFAQPSHPEHLK